MPQGHLYALERSTGAVRWKHPFPGGVGAQVLRWGETALAVTGSGEVAAVDIESGKMVWSTSPSDGAGDRLLDPVLADGRLFVGWRSGYVDALDAATGRRLWRTHLPERLNTSLSLSGAAVVAGTLGGGLYRLSHEDGGILQRLDLKGVAYGDIVEAGGCLLVLSAEDLSSEDGPATLTCFDPSLAKVSWSFRSKGAISTFHPLVHQGRAVIGWQGTLVALDLVTGSEAWSCPLQGVPRGLGVSGEILYVGTLSGPVLALDPARCAESAGFAIVQTPSLHRP